MPDIVRELKSKVSVAVLALCRRKNRQMGKLWQHSYHDHIVRDEKDSRRIYEYIENNPLQWELDCHNPESEKHKNWIDTRGCVPSVGTGLAPVRFSAPNAPDEEQDGAYYALYEIDERFYLAGVIIYSCPLVVS